MYSLSAKVVADYLSITEKEKSFTRFFGNHFSRISMRTLLID
jgi:hypothetical protein